eukprot:CAMPEP_0176098780 /NCGR_PEP_ID=MMETSP0120_2-20121206/49531_1 /TAXON_ID=160619 /ORGANISM="Kryptoperidinium foliaceum, Strain CCMP 1326" /LENGTH=357 /DNA_ID=CAMNT_0017432795 /DNA_START=54 /DNA_END=1124 /DNA_ORIENTATION=-
MQRRPLLALLFAVAASAAVDATLRDDGDAECDATVAQDDASSMLQARTVSSSGGLFNILGIGGGFSRYPGYKGPIVIGGGLWVTSGGNGRTANSLQKLSFRLTGVDERCRRGPGLQPNSCSVQITEGSSCSEATGEHMYNSRLLRKNPWPFVSYASVAQEDQDGKETAGAVDLPVYTGLSAYDVNRRTVVVSDFQGERVACAELRGLYSGVVPATSLLEAQEVVDFHTYRTNSSEEVKDIIGSVRLHKKPGKTEATTGVFLTYDLEGIDNKCDSGPGPANYSCGVRLHEGTNCSDDVGASLYKRDALHADPWAGVSYIVSEGWKRMSAKTAAKPINTGLMPKDIRGRALVLYNFDGK